MTQDLYTLSLDEISSVLSKAQKVLSDRQQDHRREVIKEIKSLAASVGLTISMSEEGKSIPIRGSKAPIKFRNPNDSSQTWTGRGIKPLWLSGLLKQGHSIESFKI